MKGVLCEEGEESLGSGRTGCNPGRPVLSEQVGRSTALVVQQRWCCLHRQRCPPLPAAPQALRMCATWHYERDIDGPVNLYYAQLARRKRLERWVPLAVTVPPGAAPAAAAQEAPAPAPA